MRDFKDFCVLVPGKNEEVVISNSIRSLLGAGMRAEDIYVIDDGSDDRTFERASSFGVNVLRNEKNIGKALSLRRLATHFKLEDRYKYISTVDADTHVASDYFTEAQKTFAENPSIAAVCGRAKNRPHNWLVAYRCMFMYIASYVYWQGMSNMQTIFVMPGFTSIFRSDVFRKLDWNKETMVEDMDITFQIHRQKLGRILHNRRMHAYIQDPRTIGDYIKQVTRWQVGAWQIMKKHKVWTGNQRVDWELKALLSESFLFGLWLLTLPMVALFKPRWSMVALLSDIAVSLFWTLLCAAKEKRLDVLLAFPTYPFMRILDCVVFFKNFWFTVVQGKRHTVWLHVKRY